MARFPSIGAALFGLLFVAATAVAELPPTQRPPCPSSCQRSDVSPWIIVPLSIFLSIMVCVIVVVIITIRDMRYKDVSLSTNTLQYEMPAGIVQPVQ